MQPNGVATDIATDGGLDPTVNDIHPDITVGTQGAPPSQPPPQAVQHHNQHQHHLQHHHHHHHHHQQQHQHQHQLTSTSASPVGQIHLQHAPQTMQGVGINHHHHLHQQQQHQQHHHLGFAPSGDHQHHQVTQHLPGGYYQRPAQPQYHNQHEQQPMQHYHHNKYNNPNRGGGLGVVANGQGGVDNESNVNHVLLITVINPHYTITCDLIHQVCSTYGKVNRIVIFKKNGVQAMVEFDNVESAKRAKVALYGCDIYSGCCTLRIEYAKPTRLNIHKNDNDSFDYTNSDLNNSIVQVNEIIGITDEQGVDHLGAGNHTLRGGRGGNGTNNAGMQHFHPTHQHSLTNSPHIQNSVAAQHGNSNVYVGSLEQQPNAFHQEEGFNVSRAAPTGSAPYPGNESYIGPHGHHANHHQHGDMYSRQDNHLHGHQRNNLLNNPIIGRHNHQDSSFPPANTSGALMVEPNNLTTPPQRTVMMVYGLQPEKVNCDRLFNLLCLYGNLVKIKFLRTKEGCAMVQMDDVLAVDRCVSSLNKISLFNSELQISYSKQAFLHDVIQPFALPDGSPSFKDFTGNKNNRFKNPEVASKNRILPPSQVLHFFNAPYGISEEELVHLFKSTSGHEPVAIKMFTPKNNTKSFTGLATFRDAADATEVLVLCNHLSMPKPGAPHPYILRLCFSPPAYIRSPPSDPSAHR